MEQCSTRGALVRSAASIREFLYGFIRRPIQQRHRRKRWSLCTEGFSAASRRFCQLPPCSYRSARRKTAAASWLSREEFRRREYRSFARTVAFHLNEYHRRRGSECRRGHVDLGIREAAD